MRILVPVDRSAASQHVLAFLNARTALLGQNPHIEVLNVQYSIPQKAIEFFELHAVKQQHLNEGKQILDALNSQGALDTLKADRKVLYGEVAKVVIEEAERLDADLIVMGIRGLDAIKSLLLGSVSTEVISKTNLPVLLIRPHTPVVKEPTRVGILVDGSRYGSKAANFVLTHRALFGEKAHFTVVHAQEMVPDPIAPNPMSPMSRVLSREEINAHQREFFQKTIAEVTKPFENMGIDIDAQLVLGVPEKALPQYVNEHFDMIVMGSHGYGNFTAAVMGSTAMHIAANSDLPILVIR